MNNAQIEARGFHLKIGSIELHFDSGRVTMPALVATLVVVVLAAWAWT